MKKIYAAGNIILVLFLALSFTGCKKIKEDIAMKFLLDAMTNGKWIVDVYKEADVDETAAFEGYEFQFTKDGKVYAITGTGQTEGTWKGDVDNLTIYSNFPSAGDPLKKLNDTFKIINNTTKLVEAEPFNGSRDVYLKLVKKS
ncbi:MAG: hypothetical protein KF862_00635 [Chitinophagaceae bacterium]|nr:hypothetical protein [Chitinophagaceae bacterium]